MRNQKTYFLDLQTLLIYLADQSCELTTELKLSGKAARGSLILKEGKIASCTISFQNGYQIVGEQAYKLVEMSTQWQVELEKPEEKRKKFALPPAPTQFSPRLSPEPFLEVSPSSVSNPWSPPLKQKGSLDLALLQNLPIKERLVLRSVFAMINGQRSNDEIKAQLHLSSRDIDNALTRLHVLNLIE
jgi:hypothetical protein